MNNKTDVFLQGEPARVSTVQGMSGEKGTPGRTWNLSVEEGT
jgi:hypothetical protein